MTQLKIFFIVVVCSVLMLATITKAQSGTQLTATMPPRAPTCALNCPGGEGAICASNSVTYKNQCRFECAQQRNKRLRKIKNGACTSSTSLSDYRRG